MVALGAEIQGGKVNLNISKTVYNFKSVNSLKYQHIKISYVVRDMKKHKYDKNACSPCNSGIYIYTF